MKKVKDSALQMTIFNFIEQKDEEEKENIERNKRILEMKSVAKKLGLQLKKSDKWEEDAYFVEDSWLEPNFFEARLYALKITYDCLGDNSLVFIPTGLGKTYIKLLLSIIYLKKNPSKKVVFLAPTKVLCHQHCSKINDLSSKVKAGELTGWTNRKDRLSVWETHSIIVATPQTILAELDQANGVGKIEDVQVIIFDEVHNLTGDYAYTLLAKIYTEFKSIRILGFSASPDSQIEKLEKLRKTLQVSYQNIITRTEESPDVKPYIHHKSVVPIFLKRSTSSIQKTLKSLMTEELANIIDKMIKKFKSFKVFNGRFEESIRECLYYDDEKITGINVKKFNLLKEEVQKYLERNPKCSRCYDFFVDWALVMIFNWAVTCINNGLNEFRSFLEKKYYGDKSKKRKSSQSKIPKSQENFLNNPKIQLAIKILHDNKLWSKRDLKFVSLESSDHNQNMDWGLMYEDEKLEQIKKLISRRYGSQILIFTSYRDTLNKVISFLESNFSLLKIDKLIGQTNKFDDAGMKQKEQIAVLKKFRNREIDILISTSIGEQGLNFPSVDIVIFYEPITDIRRCIQRMGRTARYREGTVFILLYKGEKEERIFYIFKAREKRVKEIIKFYEDYKGSIY